MGRKNFLRSTAAFFCMIRVKEYRAKGKDSVYLHTCIWLFSLAVVPTQLSVQIIFAFSIYGIQKASENKGDLNMFAMDIAFMLYQFSHLVKSSLNWNKMYYCDF